MKDVRLLPLVIGAVAALLLLKALALTLESGVAGVGFAFAQTEPATAGERAVPESRSRDSIIESLGERREALEARERELDLRERLLDATRQRVEERITELREIEARIEATVDARNAEHSERFASLVTMYQSMKPRDAAKIFNGLEMPILVRVAAEINARNMAEIMASMDPDVAQRLTAELSTQPPDVLEVDEGDELPQIVGTRRNG